jgi:hypothetical protein
MSRTDARFLAPDAHEALRTRVMAALRGGMKPVVAGRCLFNQAPDRKSVV